MATVEDPRIIEFDVRTDEMLVNMGPQHPSTHGVLRLVLRTDGEVISEVVPHIGYLQKCEEFLDQFGPIIDEYHTLLTSNSIFVKRTAGIGVLSPEMAISYGTSGPVLRGSGIDHDLRRDGEEIYTSMYEGYAFEIV